MTRRRRNPSPTGFYHVTSRGVRRSELYSSDLDYLRFEQFLDAVTQEHGWWVPRHCLIPNHFHLLVRCFDPAALSAGMKALKQRYAWHLNHLRGTSRHAFEARFYAGPIETAEHLTAAARYIEDNPVDAGLVERSEDWRWLRLRSLEPSAAPPVDRS